jgi:hypothetical protein
VKSMRKQALSAVLLGALHAAGAAAQDAPPPPPDMPGLPPADDIPPLPDMPGLPPADDIPALPDMPGLPPANDIAGPSATPSKKKPAAADEDAGETVVRVRRRARAVTSTRTSVAEAQRLPGTQGDAIRVIESLPGVGRASFASGQLLLWGASPDSSRVYVDGVPIPRLFHGGGLRSSLNGFFVKDIELVPGAYGADYGNATAGMVRVSTADLQQGVHGVASVDFLDGSATASANPAKKLYVGAGYRYGYLNKLAPLVASKEALQYTLIPRYQDYQGRAEWRFSENHRVSLMAFGSFDRASASFTSDDPARARASGQVAEYNRAVLTYTGQTQGGATARIMAYAGTDKAERTESVGPYPFNQTSDAVVFGMRSSWLGDITPHMRLHAGVAVESSITALNRVGSLTRPPREGDAFAFGQPPAGDSASDAWHVTQVNVGPYIETPLSFWDKRIDVTPGLRLSATLTNASREFPPAGDTPTHGVAQQLVFVEPRLMTTLRATPKLGFKIGGGLYHAPPNPGDLSSVFGNAKLGSPRSMQGIVGSTYDLTSNVSAEAVAFVRKIDNYTARNTTNPLPAGQALTQDGEARAFGGQIMIRRRFARGFTGWISYTLTRSEVRYHPGESYRLADFDQTHLFTGVASYDLGKGFTFGARMRIISGLPRTPVTGRVYDAVSSDYQPVFGDLNGVRLPMIYALDARIDKTFKIGSGKLIVFLDALNVLNRPPAEEIVYDSTYTQRDYLRGLPIVADFGLRGEL